MPNSTLKPKVMPFALRFAEPLALQEELEKSLKSKVGEIRMGTTVQTYEGTLPHGYADPKADPD